MSFPAYPVYKDSGVDWLGEIPEGWSIKPLWALFRRHKLTGFPDEQLLSVYRDYGVIPKASRDDNFNKPSDDLGAYQLVQVGDLAINKMKAWQGSVGISSHKGIVSPAYHVYAPSHSEAPQYLHHLFRCNEYIAGYLANSKGIRVNQWDLEPQQHSRMSVLLPSFQEQTQIARFLDHETARIDALIEEQQRLIELLKEKRQAVISHAVTKGLDPTVPMKDSGVEWLGEVPAHWEVTKFKWPLRTASGGTPPSNDRETYYDGGIPWLRSLDLTDDLITEYEVTVTQRAVQETACKVVPKSSVLIAMYGGDGTIGKNGLLTFDSAINQAICAFLPSDRCVPEYLHRYIQFYRPYWMIGAESSRKDPNIGQDRIGDHFLVLPPPQEQSEIVAFLGVELLKFSALIKEAQTGVEFLQERRSALISAAVTGKIDVRNWQSPASTQAPKLEVAEAN